MLRSYGTAWLNSRDCLAECFRFGGDSVGKFRARRSGPFVEFRVVGIVQRLSVRERPESFRERAVFAAKRNEALRVVDDGLDRVVPRFLVFDIPVLVSPHRRSVKITNHLITIRFQPKTPYLMPCNDPAKLSNVTSTSLRRVGVNYSIPNHLSTRPNQI